MSIEALAMQTLSIRWQWLASSRINLKRRQKVIDVMSGWDYNEPIKSRNTNQKETQNERHPNPD